MTSNWCYQRMIIEFNVILSYYCDGDGHVCCCIYQKMPRKCCVPLCKTNYKTGTPGKTYRFPKNEEERGKWQAAIPRKKSDFKITSNTVVCEKHWPADLEHYVHYGKIRPVHPPSIFPGVPASCLRTQAKRRKTRTSLEGGRGVVPDEIDAFAAHDSLTYDNIIEKVPNIAGLVAFEELSGNSIIVQSKEMDGGIPRFSIEIQRSLKFSAYHMGVLTCIKTLSSNRIRKLSCLSSLQEAVQYLRRIDGIEDRKKNIITEQIKTLGLIMMGCIGKVYPTQMIVRCFEYFAVSRALYKRLCNDFQLPSVRTLTRLTSKFSSICDIDFISKLFGKIPTLQRKCVILIDEVYVKAALRFHGGTVFGKAANDSSKLARTVLCFMVKCMFGGPKFVAKMIPVCKV